MDKEVLRKELHEIIKSVEEFDYTDILDVHTALATAEKDEWNKTPYGIRYINRLHRIIESENDSTCIVCEKQEAENRIVCSKCIEALGSKLDYSSTDGNDSNIEESTYKSPYNTFCPNCMKEVSTDITICPNCGKRIKKRSGNKITSNKMIIFLGVGAIAVIGMIILIGVLIKNNNPLKKYEELIEQGNIEEAKALYEEKIVTNEDWQSVFLENKKQEIEGVFKEYQNDTIAFEEAVDFVERYKEYEGLEKDVEAAVKGIKALNSEREKYHDAENLEKEGDIIGAINAYGSIKENEERYQEAQEKIKELKESYKNSRIKEAEKLAEEKQYEDALAVLDDITKSIGDSSEVDALRKKYNEDKYNRGECDVRNAKWGDSKDTVKKFERCEIYFEDSDYLVYKDILDGVNVYVMYYFNDVDQLYTVIYTLDASYSNYDYYIRDYDNFLGKLTDKYGKPTDVNDFVSNNSLAKYCKTEGEKLLMGYLGKESIWEFDDMRVKIKMENAGSLTFLIGYMSKVIPEPKGDNKY